MFFLLIGLAAVSGLVPQRRHARHTRLHAAASASTEAGRLLAEQLKGTNLYLVGMMGCGKSSVGDELTRMLGSYAFVDTDSTLETAMNSTVAEFFAAEGEDAFRKAEGMILNQVAAYVRLVVGTGGGIVTQTANWAALRSGIVVWINPAVDVLEARLLGAEMESRPLLKDASDISRILEERTGFYDQADVSVSVESLDELPRETAAKVVQDVLDFIRKNPPKKEPNPIL
mmetsp:Transcript_2122/g.7525  ORF Transcript_2122/g.7525 Transcript_2122/m.7525 type:complete len:229 (+) Transcript_2122:28-714(+)